ncbi:MAG: hypothetical protein IJW72_07335 [Alphaproteobacteria bacterium]|nr:hypothetical protein [Alphaproteobacteria bacterium]
MKNKIAIIAFLLSIFLIGAKDLCAEQDSGTGADGVAVICSKTMAMRCGISSSDGKDKDKIKECLDKIASDMYGSQIHKISVTETRDKILHECSKTYYELAVKYKADAGDFVDKGDENGNSDLKTDKHGKKEQEGKITASNAKGIIGIMDVYSSMIVLDSIEIFFNNIANRQISEEMKDNGEEKFDEAPAETGGNNV